MDCSPPGFSVHGILQVRLLEWAVIRFSRGCSQPRDWTHVSCIVGRFFITEPPGARWLRVRALWKWKSLSCVQLCNPIGCIVCGILQARIPEWVAFPVSRGSSQLRDRTQVSCIAGGFFTNWATREAQEYWSGWPIPSPADLPDPGIDPGSPALQADSWGHCRQILYSLSHQGSPWWLRQ